MLGWAGGRQRVPGEKAASRRDTRQAAGGWVPASGLGAHNARTHTRTHTRAHTHRHSRARARAATDARPAPRPRPQATGEQEVERCKTGQVFQGSK